MSKIGLLKKSTEYIMNQQKRKNEILLVINQLLEIKTNLSYHILDSQDSDTLIETISRISESIKKLEDIKEEI